MTPSDQAWCHELGTQLRAGRPLDLAGQLRLLDIALEALQLAELADAAPEETEIIPPWLQALQALQHAER